MNCTAHARALLLLPALAAACVQPDPAPNYLPAYEPLDESDPGWARTRPLLLVSDCQLFNVSTEPLPERNLSAQSMVATAIRSPQLNLFSRDVLRWILDDEESHYEAAIHLGDAADLGCEGEFREFVELMSDSGTPWLMAPGNHDCFYFGNNQPERIETWESACKDAGQPMFKDRFVRMYVASLLQQQDPGFAALAEALGLSDQRDLDLVELGALLPLQFDWEAPAASNSLLDAISWDIDEEHPWRSFVLQRADIGGLGSGSELSAVAIVMDSCQYWVRPAIVPNAWSCYPMPLNVGLTGEMLSNQLRIVREWVEELDPETEFAIMMSHHPVGTYSAKTQSSVRWLWREHYNIGTFVTAHTHHGHYAHHFLEEGREEVELNIGSTTDWPMEWRTLEVLYRHDAIDRWYVKSKRYLLHERLRNEDGYFLPGWEIPLGAPDDYRAFRQGTDSVGAIMDIYLGYHLRPPIFGAGHPLPRKGSYATEARYKDTLLGTFDRLVTLFPTDVGEGEVVWPSGCASDAEVLARIQDERDPQLDTSKANKTLVPVVDEKIELVTELIAFEDSRRTRDPESGESLDDAKARYRLSQAVWASRYGFTRGRRLEVEDEYLRIGVDPEFLRPGQKPANAQNE